MIDRRSLLNDTLPPPPPEETPEDGDEESSQQRTKRATSSRTSHTVDSPHFVETMIAADWSMQDFHSNGLTLYLTTMMNIVSQLISK